MFPSDFADETGSDAPTRLEVTALESVTGNVLRRGSDAGYGDAGTERKTPATSDSRRKSGEIPVWQKSQAPVRTELMAS